MMDRKTFLKVCGGACASAMGISFLVGCAPDLMINASIENKNLVVPAGSFVKEKDGAQGYRRYILVRNEQLNYPVALFRAENGEYKALLMRCTHQGMELSVQGDLISCAAHGSEFDTSGNVLQGPAEQPLKTFITRTDATNIYIQLA